MNGLKKAMIAALAMGTVAIGAATPANAYVNLSVGVGVPVYGYGYDYYQPCNYYWRWNLPGPSRCYRDYYNFYGPGVFINEGFVFRDRYDFYRWRDRPDYRRWRAHDFRGPGFGHPGGWRHR